MPSGRGPYQKIAQSSEACLLLMLAEGAERRFLVFTDPEFYENYRRLRQGRVVEANGVEIMLVPIPIPEE